MKLMIASDIHGSAYYCGRLLRSWEEEAADRLLLLGDTLYHGPRNDLPREYNPKKVTEMLNGISRHILCVRGNCDTEVDQMVLAFPIMAEYCMLYAEGRMIFASHGHHFPGKELPFLGEGDVFLYGHTHVPVCEEKGGILYLNPGSVSIPKEGSRHSYMLLEEGTFYWKGLEGETYLTRKL